MFSSLKARAKQLKTQTYTLYLASQDRRTPWYAKALMIAVVGYAISPVDLIPDFIPVLGYLDDLVIVPAGIVLALKMIPKDVYQECRARAESGPIDTRAKWVVLSVIVVVWLLVVALAIRFVWGLIVR